jgi:hypothetical protein
MIDGPLHYFYFTKFTQERGMKSTRITIGFLAVAFAILTSNPAVAQITVTIDLNHALMVEKIDEVRNDPNTIAHVSAIRDQIMAQQAVAKPLELTVVDPILRGALMNPIRTQIMQTFQGRMASPPGIPPRLESLGALPGLIAPGYP